MNGLSNSKLKVRDKSASSDLNYKNGEQSQQGNDSLFFSTQSRVDKETFTLGYKEFNTLQVKENFTDMCSVWEDGTLNLEKSEYELNQYVDRLSNRMQQAQASLEIFEYFSLIWPSNIALLCRWLERHFYYQTACDAQTGQDHSNRLSQICYNLLQKLSKQRNLDLVKICQKLNNYPIPSIKLLTVVLAISDIEDNKPDFQLLINLLSFVMLNTTHEFEYKLAYNLMEYIKSNAVVNDLQVKYQYADEGQLSIDEDELDSIVEIDASENNIAIIGGDAEMCYAKLQTLDMVVDKEGGV